MRPSLCLAALLVVVIVCSGVEAQNRKYFEKSARKVDVDFAGPSDPLILTHYLNDPATARKLSEVHGVGSSMSYSGYFTVNETFGSNMFFWLFPAQNGNPNAPLVMFLQGGPGASSMYGNFRELGPYHVAADGKTLVPNPYTWNKEYALVRALYDAVSLLNPPHF
jgi:vitellogenic carboxypeptidase-like protein